ncbi:histidine kinase [Sphingosinicella sp. LHD-64]|uniref:sensor histidine kinase n=1 Tax=Sphingosinicella sp. LHD-64 TaxID=3072139 RepID=UPI00280E68B0|nr:histidine kinase [Sphingosinicella sp. LHD-64]MDQ8757531.1 histidine kinase [Sphingosinicella sp. LHD-64]
MPGLVMDWVEEAPQRAPRRGLRAAFLGRGLTPRTRAMLWLTLLFWLSNFLILSAGILVSGNGPLAALVAMRGLLTLFGLFLCYLLHRALDRWSGPSFRSRVLLAALLAPVTAEVFAWAAYFATTAVDPSRIGTGFSWAAVISTLSYWTWFFLAWAGLYLALGYSYDVQAERLHSAELRAHAQAAQLRALHNQVNPHFLFNSLNSISALIVEERNVDAERMVTRLATFFRRSLSIDPFEDIPLEREIDLQRAYLEIEQLRYPDLVLAIDCPPALAHAAVPALILQPLVENAVKYGVAASAPPARIAIAAHAEDGHLTLAVSDSGTAPAGAAKEGTGVGLKNVRERLAQRFGDRQSLAAGRTPTGFTCTLTMPLRMLS